MNFFTKVIRPDLLGKTLSGKTMVFAVKANIGCGYPASCSTPTLQDWVPKNGFSPVVRCLLNSGHRLAAITNMHELAFGITSENPAFGDVENPHKPGYFPGGSSGGSAAAVSMNAVSFALGTDTVGSVRIPASLCGVVGYRPTTGVYSTTAVCPLSSTADTIGVLACRVTTVQLVHKALDPSYAPEARSLFGARIGVPRQYYFSSLDSEVSGVTELALETLREAGVELVECNIDFPSDFESMVLSMKQLLAYEIVRLIPKYLKEHGAPVSFELLCENSRSIMVQRIIPTAQKISEERYRECQQDSQEIRKHFDNYFSVNNLDGFVVPTTILPALKRPSPAKVTVSGEEFLLFHAYIHNTMPQASAGVPCISIPSGLSSKGLPIGLELVAPRGRDGHLLDMAVAIQQVLPTLPELMFESYN